MPHSASQNKHTFFYNKFVCHVNDVVSDKKVASQSNWSSWKGAAIVICDCLFQFYQAIVCNFPKVVFKVGVICCCNGYYTTFSSEVCNSDCSVTKGCFSILDSLPGCSNRWLPLENDLLPVVHPLLITAFPLVTTNTVSKIKSTALDKHPSLLCSCLDAV